MPHTSEMTFKVNEMPLVLYVSVRQILLDIKTAERCPTEGSRITKLNILLSAVEVAYLNAYKYASESIDSSARSNSTNINLVQSCL